MQYKRAKIVATKRRAYSAARQLIARARKLKSFRALIALFSNQLYKKLFGLGMFALVADKEVRRGDAADKENYSEDEFPPHKAYAPR